MAQRAAVLGTGTMGAPMARNLLAAGFEVSVWNRTPERARALAGDGADPAGSPAAAVGDAAFVLTMLPDAEAVESVMRDAAGSVPRDAVWIQASTVGMDVERLARLADEYGIAFVDAPVIGTKAPAEQGALIVLASGPSDAVERCGPVFDAIGSRTIELGETGAGSRMKLVTNAWIVALVESLAETIAFAESIGVDPEKFLDAIDGGPIGPPYARMKGTMMVERDFPTSFALKLALKDARLVQEAAERSGIDLPLLDAVVAQMARASERHGDEDMAATIHATLH